MSGAQPQVSPQEMSQALAKLHQVAGDESEEAVASFEQRQTQAFNALNAERKGVVTLPNGLQYEVLKAGSGRQPQASDSLTINYKASLPNGVVVDSTYKEGSPATVRLDEVAVPGLRQALGLMQEGAQWRVFVPPALGFPEYSDALRDRPLIYEVELIKVTPAAPAANAQ